jgi:hypothetical protein
MILFFSAKHNEQEFNPAIFIEGPISSHEIGRLCISARSIDFASLYDFSTLLEQFQKLPHCWNSSKNYHTVGTVPKTTTLLEQFQKLPHCWNSSKNYHTVGTVPKTTTLLEQFQKLPHCCSNSVVVFGTVPTVW